MGRLPLQSLTRSVHAGAGLLTWEQGWHQPACTCKDGRSFRFLTCGQRTRSNPGDVTPHEVAETRAGLGPPGGRRCPRSQIL